VVFLKKVVRDLALANVLVHHGRIEDLAGRETYDTVAVRALENPIGMLPYCLELVGPQGALVLFKGPRWAQESPDVERIAAQSGFVITRTERIALPGTARSTEFVELARA
jgi:16S rRNA (guanine527-N7)-methyltransferase